MMEKAVGHTLVNGLFMHFYRFMAIVKRFPVSPSGPAV